MFKFLAALLTITLPLASFADEKVTAAFSQPIGSNTRAKVVIGQISLPDHPAPGEVRVEMKCGQICQSDRRVLMGTKKSEAITRSIVLGHEGVGRIDQLSAEALAQGYELGQHVVVLPHYVAPSDVQLARGTPNLSPEMKHLGFSLHGIFAEKMDLPAYTIFPIPRASQMISQFGEDVYYQQLVNAEPLACVQRAYKLLMEKLPNAMSAESPRVLILGAGPMGLIHNIHLKGIYPQAKVVNYDPVEMRRTLTRNLLGADSVIDSTAGLESTFDLVIVSTSSRSANEIDAPALVKNGGTVLLFSGINMQAGDSMPTFQGLDIETLHRYEDVRPVSVIERNGSKKTFHFLGSSGYTINDIVTSIAELHKDLQGPLNYAKITTTRIDDLNSHAVVDLTGQGRDITYNVPALEKLLEFETTEVFSHQKVSVRFPSCKAALRPAL
jgi:threonine dehydrogenase-like Zn-dependent dehydrogenase